MSISELIERLEKATGPGREDDLYLLALVGQKGEWSESDIQYALSSIETTTCPRHYTKSLNDAIRLLKNALPGWDYSIEDMTEDGAYARIWKHGYHDDTVVRAESHGGVAIALCLSVLLALKAIEDEK